MGAGNQWFLAAVKALAVVRKLAVPAPQINVARRRVCVAAPAVVAAGGV